MQLAHKFAVESDRIVADMVEASEFPHMVQRYAVMGVPKTVVNEIPAVEGALPEAMFIDHILAAAQLKRS